MTPSEPSAGQALSPPRAFRAPAMMALATSLCHLPGNLGSNLILVTEIDIQFAFLDESRKLPRIKQYDLAVHVVV
jgi:hypothetical protein